MSSLDRAFFRAYSKDQGPAAAPVEAIPGGPLASDALPYVHFQSQQRPQLRYRLEDSHAPWGTPAAPAPHVHAPPAGISLNEDMYDLAPAAEEPPPPSAWSHQPVLHLHTRQFELTTPNQPAPSTAKDPMTNDRVSNAPMTTEGTRNDAFGLYAEEIVCLPGMAAPESNYLASLTSWPAEPVAQQVVVIEPVTVVAEEPIAAVVPVEELQIREEVVVDEAPAIHVAPPVAAPMPPKSEGAQLLADEGLAFWEVDQYLYPEMTDRLLRDYGYFAHAGEKLQQASAAGLKLLGITGVGRDEGRTTLAICLARSAAKANLRVALVDCDFERPHLAQQLGLEVAHGWQSVAAGQLALAEVAIRSLDDHLTLIPLTADAATGALSLADVQAKRVLAEIAAMHDVVVLDLGPLNGESLISGQIAAAIVVWDRRVRGAEEVQAIARQLSTAGVEAVGIAENFVAAARE